MGAKAIKLGSWDKHPAYCYDWNVNVWHARSRINMMIYILLNRCLPKRCLFKRCLIGTKFNHDRCNSCWHKVNSIESLGIS